MLRVVPVATVSRKSRLEFSFVYLSENESVSTLWRGTYTIMLCNNSQLIRRASWSVTPHRVSGIYTEVNISIIKSLHKETIPEFKPLFFPQRVCLMMEFQQRRLFLFTYPLPLFSQLWLPVESFLLLYVWY